MTQGFGAHLRATVWVRFVAPREHYWPEAPLDALHGRLRSMHRHLFHFEIAVEVTDADRQVSFESLRAGAQLIVSLHIPQQSAMSCEAMALRIAQSLVISDRLNVYSVTVSEDGESGATIYRAQPLNGTGRALSDSIEDLSQSTYSPR